MLGLRRAGGRAAVLAAVALAALGLVGGCTPDLSGVRLVVASGAVSGVYHDLGNALGRAWSARLGMPPPAVLTTDGSVANLRLLRDGRADVAFSAADAAVAPGSGTRALRALARIYDDYVQVVVRADDPIRHLADLRGKRVSVGSPNSGVQLIAKRLLAEAKIGANQLRESTLGLDDSITALDEGRIDAFFWSGGLPTRGIAQLAKRLPLHVLDLSDVLPTVQHDYPVYGTASVPATAYGLRGGPVTTMVVPNFLLATDAMSDDVAEQLVRALFDAQPDLVAANEAARSIDVHTAIQTAPIELHPGALAYYREIKA